MDLTKITTPFGLLDEATQKALRECGGPWEFYNSDGWEDVGERPQWIPVFAIRLKPQPPKPRTVWLNKNPENGFWHECHDWEIGATLFREVLEP